MYYLTGYTVSSPITTTESLSTTPRLNDSLPKDDTLGIYLHCKRHSSVIEMDLRNLRRHVLLDFIISRLVMHKSEYRFLKLGGV